MGAITEPPGRGGVVVIVDDLTLAREGLATLFEDNGYATAQAWGIPSLVRAVSDASPVALVLSIDVADCAALLRFGLDLRPAVPVIMVGLSVERESEIVTCVEAGVAGLHLKSEPFEDLLEMVSGVSDGRTHCSGEVAAILTRRVYRYANDGRADASLDSLSAREQEILDLLAEGLTNRQIATRIFVTPNTVKNHVHSLLVKLGVGSRHEAAAVARRTRSLNRVRRSLIRIHGATGRIDGFPILDVRRNRRADNRGSWI